MKDSAKFPDATVAECLAIKTLKTLCDEKRLPVFFHQPEIGHHHEDDEMRSPSIYFSRLQDVDIKLVPLTIELSYFVFGGGVHDYRHETLARCFVYLWLEKVHIFLIFPSPKVYPIHDLATIELL